MPTQPSGAAALRAGIPLWTEDVATAGPFASLDSDVEADVCIVGAGFTGLWTAFHLLRARPQRRVVVLEASTVAAGASGRNGGWCSALLPMSAAELDRGGGPGAARRARRLMIANLDELLTTNDALGLDPTATKGGTLPLARSALQQARLRGEHEPAGDDDGYWLDAAAAAARTGASELHGAWFDPHCAAVHPGRLVHGLARTVVARGAQLFERTAALAVGPRRVATPRATVRAEHVILATEAFRARLPGQRRTVLPIYSLMIATEPLGEEVLAKVGLAARETFADARSSIIYGQRTADGRIAFGGRGAPYHFASSIHPRHDTDRRVLQHLQRTLADLYPVLGGTRLTHHWGGPLGVARDWWWSVGHDPLTGVGWAGGYVGDGVATTHLAARTLTDLIDGAQTERTAQPWVQHRSPRWEPEPLRWLGVNAALALPEVIDAWERRRGRAATPLRRLLRALTSK